MTLTETVSCRFLSWCSFSNDWLVQISIMVSVGAAYLLPRSHFGDHQQIRAVKTSRYTMHMPAVGDVHEMTVGVTIG